jgi:methylaspartate ammonia-lyase
MDAELPSIVRLIIAERDPLLIGGRASVSIGIVLSNRLVHWGDCLPVDGLEARNPTVRRLVDLCESRLTGQHLVGFRPICQHFRSAFPATGRVPLADSVRGAIEQGLLSAVASAQGIAEHELLIQEYETKSSELNKLDLAVIVAVNDSEATADGVAKLLTLRPHGIGYRLTADLVAESIGADAEYLIEFVGDLSNLARQLSNMEPNNPTIYISLNGAFGRLAEDPVRYIGKIVEICRNLEDAAKECPLILEDVFVFKEPLAQAANYGRLKKLLSRAPRPQTIKQAQLVATAKTIEADALSVYCETGAIDGIVYEPLLASGLDETMNHWSLANKGGEMNSVISYSHQPHNLFTQRWITSASNIMLATSCHQIIVNQADGYIQLIDSVNRHIAQSLLAR